MYISSPHADAGYFKAAGLTKSITPTFVERPGI
jgi:hypothetical protein